MSKKPGGKSKEQSESLWARLVTAQADELSKEPNSSSTVVFCGGRKSGKTTILERFMKGTKDDYPKATVALDYKYARFAHDASTSKSIAHIFDLGGDERLSHLVNVAITPANVESVILTVTVDLGEAASVVPSLIHWIAVLRARVDKCLEQAAGSGQAAAARVQKLRDAVREKWESHADNSHVRPFPVPLIIFGAKWDMMDVNKRRTLCQALRYFATVSGAYLVCTSTRKEDRQTLEGMKSLCRRLFFGTASIRLPKEEMEHEKPLFICPGTDTLANIPVPPGKQHHSEDGWKKVAETSFGTYSLSVGEGAGGDEQLDGVKFAENTIDAMLDQKREELKQYRAQVERSRRLVSEGINVADARSIGT